MTELSTDLSRPRGDYGFDGDYRVLPAPVVAVLYLLICLVPAVFTVVNFATGATVAGALTGCATVLLMAVGASAIRATRVGKFEAWAHILTGLELRGDEHLLDLGCGRGAVMLTATKLLPEGRATWIDLWQPDQTGNSPEATRRNADLEGVADRISLQTGDMTQLPFETDSFDVIVSSLAIHNIPTMAGRLAAVDEALRVLRPGGRLAIADIGFTKRYAERLRQLTAHDVQLQSLGPRFWIGGPFLATHLVTATKPGAAEMSP